MAAEHAAKSEGAARGGSGVMKLVKAIAFVSVIVILEVAAATVLLPSAEETKQLGERLYGSQAEGEATAEAGEETSHGESHGADEHGAGAGPTKEVGLGSYHVVSFNPTTGTSLNIDFELFGVVLAADETEFNERFLLHEKRINEQVTIAIRSLEPSDFTDPGLGLIKRIILEKVNRALGKSLVHEAVFSEFAFIER